MDVDLNDSLAVLLYITMIILLLLVYLKDAESRGRQSAI